MSATNQPGLYVVYVSGAAPEPPPEVQNWLGGAEHVLEYSPDIYDTLALLAGRKSPGVLIVDLGSVDWNELEFFEQARRLCGEGKIFVVGGEHERAKLEAACAAGAALFDAAVIELEPAKGGGIATEATDSGGLLAGSLPSSGAGYQPPGAEASPRRRVKPATPPIKSEPAKGPPVRLVRPSEHDDQEVPVVFPWSPASGRPMRTPPKPQPEKGGDQAASEAREKRNDDESLRRPPIQLTQEELDALRGHDQQEEGDPPRERHQC